MPTYSAVHTYLLLPSARVQMTTDSFLVPDLGEILGPKPRPQLPSTDYPIGAFASFSLHTTLQYARPGWVYG